MKKQNKQKNRPPSETHLEIGIYLSKKFGMEVNFHVQLLKDSIYVIRVMFQFICLCNKKHSLKVSLHLDLQRVFTCCSSSILSNNILRLLLRC